MIFNKRITYFEPKLNKVLHAFLLAFTFLSNYQLDAVVVASCEKKALASADKVTTLPSSLVGPTSSWGDSYSSSHSLLVRLLFRFFEGIVFILNCILGLEHCKVSAEGIAPFGVVPVELIRYFHVSHCKINMQTKVLLLESQFKKYCTNYCLAG